MDGNSEGNLGLLEVVCNSPHATIVEACDNLKDVITRPQDVRWEQWHFDSKQVCVCRCPRPKFAGFDFTYKDGTVVRHWIAQCKACWTIWWYAGEVNSNG